MNCPASSLGATPTRKGKRAAFSSIPDLDPSPRYRRAPRARINFFVISAERRGQGSVERAAGGVGAGAARRYPLIWHAGRRRRAEARKKDLRRDRMAARYRATITRRNFNRGAVAGATL